MSVDYDRQVYGELWMMTMLTMKCQVQGTVLGLGLEVQYAVWAG